MGPLTAYPLRIDLREELKMSSAYTLVMCPYFTNGDWPPMGLACINGALLGAGHQTRCYDLQHRIYKNNFELFHLLRQLFNLGRVEDKVVFMLRPDLIMYYLFKDRYPDFKWTIEGESQERQAAAMFLLALKPLMADWADEILAGKPRAVFFSTYLSNLFMSLKLAQEIKSRKPELPVFFGGPGSGLPEVRNFVLGLDMVDGVIVGEGELTATEIAADPIGALEQGIPGLAVSKGDEVIFEPQEQIKDLNLLPPADYTGLPGPGLELEAYAQNRPNQFLSPFFEGLSLYTTRGCVNRCAYCTETAYWSGFRQRSVEPVIDQIKQLSRKYGMSRFLFGDSALNGSLDWLSRFVKQSAALDPLPSFSSYLIATRHMDREIADALATGGFDYVTLGVETFSDRMREMMNKRGPSEEVFDSIRNLVFAGINVKINILTGFPGETEDDVNESIKYIELWRKEVKDEKTRKRLVFDAGHPLRMEPYSRLYHHPEDYGIRMQGYELSLPSELDSVSELLSRMLLHWSADLDAKTVSSRSTRLEQAAFDAMNR